MALKEIWRKVHGTERPYYIFEDKRVPIKDRSRIRNFKTGREIRIGTLFSRRLIK